jgi:SAM-dependent methyltransferase
VTDRWRHSDVPRGADYDRRFESLAATGMDMHGEAALVASYRPATVLDAGCGTGRVAIELARLGVDVVGVDVDPAMLEAARAKAPALTWVEGDLTDPAFDLGRTFDVVVMAGNVLIFVPSGTEGTAIANSARHLAPGGRLVAGYSLRPGGLRPSGHDAHATAAGLELEHRWSTWDRHPYAGTDAYAVSVHRMPS